MHTTEMCRLRVISLDDPIVHAGINREGGIENHNDTAQLCELVDIIDKLVASRATLVARIIELETICPRKIRVGDTTYVYHCPDSLIPEMKR
jgi:hypothetical protein